MNIHVTFRIMHPPYFVLINLNLSSSGVRHGQAEVVRALGIEKLSSSGPSPILDVSNIVNLLSEQVKQNSVKFFHCQPLSIDFICLINEPFCVALYSH